MRAFHDPSTARAHFTSFNVRKKVVEWVQATPHVSGTQLTFMENDFLLNLLERYPKVRPPLPKEIQEIYDDYYQQNREGKSAASYVSQKVEGWLHKKVAADVTNAESINDTLELGAGTLNQLQYEPVSGAYDIVEPYSLLYSGKPELDRIGEISADISELSLSKKYDRITSVATLEHILDLPYVVAKSAMHLKDEGVFRASIPSEGTFLWTLCWRITSGLEFRIKYGVDYLPFVKHEHVNTTREIADILRYFFERVDAKCLGINNAISIYQYYECSRPNMKRCTEYVEKSQAKPA